MYLRSKNTIMTSQYPPAVIKHPPEVEYALGSAALMREAAKVPLNEEMRDNFIFTEKSIRLAFIRKVYSILMVQLLITAAFIALFKFNEQSHEFLRAHPESVFISFLVTIVTVIAMSCCVTARRVAPLNYICLFGFTIAESFLLGAICVRYESTEVLLAVGICAIVCFALTVFAFQTKYDFTTCGASLFVALFIFIIFGLVLSFFPTANLTRLIFAGIGTLIFSLYLIYDTQLLLGGNHKYSVSPEEYVFAALSLYLDVVQLFLMILRIVVGVRAN